VVSKVPSSPRASAAALLALLTPLVLGSTSLRAAGADRPPIADLLRGKDIAATSPPLDDPPRRSVAAATHMRDEDFVLGVVVSGEARAYPWWIAKNHHVVNDTIAGVPMTLAFCEQCTGGAAFVRTVGGRTLSFAVAGVYNGTIVIRDRETGTLWAPFSGRALEGPLAGRTLERIPVLLSHWDEWTARHPETEVAWAPEKSRGGHGSWYVPGKWGIVTEMGSTLTGLDPRLPENTLVYGVDGGTAARAYPLASLRGRPLVNDVVGRAKVVLLPVGAIGAAAFERTVEGRVLTFATSTETGAAMVDSETSSLWSADGVALRGPLQGRRLRGADGYLVEWHVWAAYNPATDIYGEKAAAPTAASLPFPRLTLASLDNHTPAPVPLSGRVNLVALWAAWCAPCREEMPAVQRLVQQRSASGLAAAGIAIQIPEEEELAAAREFAGQAGLAFPNFLVDDEAYGQLEALSRRAGGAGLVLPTVYVTSSAGDVLAVLTGPETARLPAVVDAALAGRPLPAANAR
jgi:thiol-disulfide isomerase/thioredoxin